MSAILDFTAFKEADDTWGRNIAFLDDGTYQSYNTRADYDVPTIIGQTAEAFPGITPAQAKTIVGVAAVPSRKKVYFFYKDGQYGRYDLTQRKITYEGPSSGWR